MNNMDNDDYDQFFKPVGRQSRVSIKPLSVSNSISSYDRKAGFYGSLPKSPQGVRKTLFEVKNKENEESSLCKDIYVDRESTGMTPIVVPHKVKYPKSDEAKEKEKIKPRKSMLGRRSKIVLPPMAKDDNTYTLSKPLHSGPSGFSSPVNSNRFDSYKWEGNFKPKLEKSTSSPMLIHPFDTNDADTSSFFTKGLSDSTWSVFKGKNTKKTELKTYPTETPLGHVGISGSTKPMSGDATSMKNTITLIKESSTYSKNSGGSSITIDKKIQLEWLALKFKQNESMTNNPITNSSTTENKIQDVPELPKSYNNGRSSKNKLNGSLQTDFSGGARTRAQIKREKEKHMCEAISPILKESNSVSSRLDESTICNDDSNDSFLQNEENIVNTCKKKQLTDITEESLQRLSISFKAEDNDKTEEDSDEYLSSNEVDENIGLTGLNNILGIIVDLNKEKDEMDSKLSELLVQKESFDKKFNELCLSLNELVNNENKRNYSKNNNKIDKSSRKKVICTKARPSLVRSPCQRKPSSNLVTLDSYSELKSNFNCLKTPIQSNKKNKTLRKSICYTPNSLSILVCDQAKDIFG